MAGSAESVEQVWLLRRVVTVCWLAAGSVLAGRASGGVSRVSYTTETMTYSPPTRAPYEPGDVTTFVPSRRCTVSIEVEDALEDALSKTHCLNGQAPQVSRGWKHRTDSSPTWYLILEDRQN